MNTGLLELVLAAHGGVERWRRVRTVRARFTMGGPTWTGLGVEGIFDDLDIAVDLGEQRSVLTGFTGPGRRGSYTPDRVAITDADGTVLRERHTPLDSFPARNRDTRWDPLQALYFCGYGMWNYLNTPYLLTRPGVRTEELAPVRTGGERWRRLRVSFPPDIATHCPEQTFYYDESGLQRRLDYAPRVMGDRAVAHVCEEHRTVSGLVFPTHRAVLPLRDGRPVAEPVIVVDLADIAVDFAG